MINEIEKLIEQLKVANERIEYLTEQRIKSAAIGINTLMSLNEAIIKIDRLEAELRQYKNADKTTSIINPEWEKLGPEHDIRFPTEEDYRPINIGPEPKSQNANLPPIS